MGTQGRMRATLPVVNLPNDRRDMRLEHEALCSINDIRDACEDILGRIILQRRRVILKGDRP
jgi:hypothetical protein